MLLYDIILNKESKKKEMAKRKEVNKEVGAKAGGAFTHNLVGIQLTSLSAPCTCGPYQ